MSGNQLGEFLRARRSLLQPDDVGLAATRARRVAGLRREEVAVLAGVSADYYARLEQGRERHPSGQVIDAIARALRLEDDAHRHAYRLAGLTPKTEQRPGPPDQDRVDPGLMRLMDALPTAVAYIVNRRLDILASNALADALLAPLADRHSMVRTLFRDPSARELFADWHAVARDTVEALRLAAGHDQHDPDINTLVVELLAESTEFAALWRDHRVSGLGSKTKVFNHPDVGRITLAYQAFEVQGTPGQYLLAGTAESGSADADSLALLGSRHTGGRSRQRPTTRPTTTKTVPGAEAAPVDPDSASFDSRPA
ncbi:helix-turn-helix transcriptional regulator [Streptomyces qinzhouensis]|uniref:Helix-turn-helix domain-containing protein n=1 Tax=Streptomyces qinzhouensis TaxID=2599401 RepID=A0A5B8JEW6_9ACTN|nr:helix-turn-helix transcriptional regulator [Streptomyces qinzhouensis]QDY79996.1 helix-turn-helix domain-containing protein [Streptomyces qinzhouensis]